MNKPHDELVGYVKIYLLFQVLYLYFIEESAILFCTDEYKKRQQFFKVWDFVYKGQIFYISTEFKLHVLIV